MLYPVELWVLRNGPIIYKPARASASVNWLAVSRFTFAPAGFRLMPMQRDEVTVERFYTEQASSLGLKLLAGANGLKRLIREPTVNRPGLALAGFTKYFASKRVQVIGAAESTFIKSLTKEERAHRYELLFSHRIPCVVFSRNIKPDRQFLRQAEAADVPILSCPLITMKFIN